MTAYHGIAAHFPIALWACAFMIIFLRSFWQSIWIVKLSTVLSPLLLFAAVMGAVSIAIGLLLWPWSAVLSSSLARNHFMFATWSLLFWSMLWWLCVRKGDGLLQGRQRFIILIAASIGMGLVAITGTLGGKLTGNSSALPALLKAVGWDVYTTFYVPTSVLLLIVITSFLMIGVALMARRKENN